MAPATTSRPSRSFPQHSVTTVVLIGTLRDFKHCVTRGHLPAGLKRRAVLVGTSDNVTRLHARASATRGVDTSSSARSLRARACRRASARRPWRRCASVEDAYKLDELIVTDCARCGTLSATQQRGPARRCEGAHRREDDGALPQRSPCVRPGRAPLGDRRASPERLAPCKRARSTSVSASWSWWWVCRSGSSHGDQGQRAGPPIGLGEREFGC